MFADHRRAALGPHRPAVQRDDAQPRRPRGGAQIRLRVDEAAAWAQAEAIFKTLLEREDEAAVCS